MEDLSISDIMWNLQSGFQGIRSQDAELVLVEREQKLKLKNAKMAENHKSLRKKNDALKKKCDKLESGLKKDSRRRRELHENLRAKRRFHSQALEDIRVLKKVIATFREEARDEIDRLREGIRDLEEEKAEAETTLKREIERHLRRIECLEKEKAIAFAEAENLKDVFVRFKEGVVGLMEDSSVDLSSTGLARLSCLYHDEVDADLEDGLDTIIKKESNRQNSSSPLNLSGQNSHPSTVASDKPTNTTTMDINCSTSDDEGLHQPNRLKRKRDLFGSPSARVVGTNHDENITIKCEYSHQNLSGQNCNPSTLLSDTPANTTIKDINYSNSDDEGLHPPNGLEWERDLSGSPSAGVVGMNHDESITIKCEPDSPMDLSSGSINPSNRSVLGVVSWPDQSVSKSITAEKCSDEKLAADVSWHWQFEADMLSAIDEAPILTLEAVCALYRQQKSCGNLSSGSAFLKNRGFDGLHAFRGTALAEFLLNGDPQGGIKKSLEELQLHDPEGLDDCKRIAISHSRQLFEIYQRQEDPFFAPK